MYWGYLTLGWFEIFEPASALVRSILGAGLSVGALEVSLGDVITFAAGVAVRATGELIAIVGRQAPGTWLPLEVRRDGSLLSLVAKFPAAP